MSQLFQFPVNDMAENRLLSDEEVWNEIARASEELFENYLEVSGLQDVMAGLERLQKKPTEPRRNFDVPMTLQVAD